MFKEKVWVTEAEMKFSGFGSDEALMSPILKNWNGSPFSSVVEAKSLVNNLEDHDEGKYNLSLKLCLDDDVCDATPMEFHEGIIP